MDVSTPESTCRSRAGTGRSGSFALGVDPTRRPGPEKGVWTGGVRRKITASVEMCIVVLESVSEKVDEGSRFGPGRDQNPVGDPGTDGRWGGSHVDHRYPARPGPVPGPYLRSRRGGVSGE